MAAVATVLGGMVGFLSAVLGMVLFALSPLHALALWSGTGIVTALVLVAIGLTTRQAASLPWSAPRDPQTNLS